MKFIVSQKQTPHGLLIVVTDKEIIGKIFTEGRLILNLTKEFYKGEEMKKDSLENVLGKARHLHLSGKNAVMIGIKQGYVDEQKVLHIDTTVHAEATVE